MKFDRLSDQVSPDYGYGSSKRDNRSFFKQTLILATAIFLMTTPAPDSHDITEITANFIVTKHHWGTSSFKVGE